MFAKIKNIWGCITTCDDKLIIEELQEEKTSKIYYKVYETSFELNKHYIYEADKLPSVLNSIIQKCHAVVKFNKDNKKHILYGPNLIKQTFDHPIYQFEEYYFLKEHDIQIIKEDKKVKAYYDWLSKIVYGNI